MSFIDSLKKAVDRVDGAVAAIIIGIDGIPVEDYTVESIMSLDDLSAEASQLLRNVNLAAETFKLGDASEFTFTLEKCAILIRRITAEYYLALIVKAGGNVGKGRFVLRMIAPKIEREF
jgi:predicted regulator of Ras-like GTPase activity (Roadblock/LC7/MglB family)